MRDAMRARGSALRQILRKWKIVERNHFTFLVAQPTFWDVSSNHISARAQEDGLADARVAFLEGVCGQLAIRMGDLVAPHPQPTPSEHVVLGPRASAGFAWVQLGFRLMRSCCCCCIDLDQWAEELVHRADRFVIGKSGEENFGWHIWTKHTSLHIQTAPRFFPIFWLTNCTQWQGSKSMKVEKARILNLANQKHGPVGPDVWTGTPVGTDDPNQDRVTVVLGSWPPLRMADSIAMRKPDATTCSAWERERERFVGCIHTKKHHAHSAQNLPITKGTGRNLKKNKCMHKNLQIL